jgi:hypothetical protein
MQDRELHAFPAPAHCGATLGRRLAAALAAFLLLALAAATSAHAWGPVGHETVGAVADKLIAGTHAGVEVRKILGGTLQTASVWADCAKGVQQASVGAPFKYTGAGHYPECAVYENAASEKQMVDFVRRNAQSCIAGDHDEERCRHKSYHYADISSRQDHYGSSMIGARDHDIVHAIDAAVAVLKGGPAPAPFHIKGKKEALRLLSHYVGDLHQPLHVVAVYLDPAGQVVDPDAADAEATATQGGNDIYDGSRKLHAEWDDVSPQVRDAVLSEAGLNQARNVPVTSGAVDDWAVVWAGETVRDGKAAFDGLQFGQETQGHHWPVSHDASYTSAREALQQQQLTRGGARLAQMLRAIWP